MLRFDNLNPVEWKKDAELQNERIGFAQFAGPFPKTPPFLLITTGEFQNSCKKERVCHSFWTVFSRQPPLLPHGFESFDCLTTATNDQDCFLSFAAKVPRTVS